MRGLLVFAVLFGWVFADDARAQSTPGDIPREEVADARRNHIGCEDVRQARDLDASRARRLLETCRRQRFRIEWVMCTFDFGLTACAERWLRPAQQRALSEALDPARPAEPPPPPTVEALEHARVDRIEVVDGELMDGGAGFGRWLARAGEACWEQAAPGGETITVEVVADDDHPSVPVPLRVTGASAALLGCIEGFSRGSHALVWTDGTHATVRARLRVR